MLERTRRLVLAATDAGVQYHRHRQGGPTARRYSLAATATCSKRHAGLRGARRGARARAASTLFNIVMTTNGIASQAAGMSSNTSGAAMTATSGGRSNTAITVSNKRSPAPVRLEATTT